jgi:hypothetical protein
MNTTHFRYPGVKPFEKEQANIFYGRPEETRNICRRIQSEKLLTIHGKSGSGKSSLVKAGVFPALEKTYKEENLNLKIIDIHFNYYQEGKPILQMNLVDKLICNLKNYCKAEKTDLLDELIPIKPSVWLEIKKIQYKNLNTPVLPLFYIDQFEEIFSYPEDMLVELIVQLAELFYGVPPKDLIDSIERMVILHPELEDRMREEKVLEFLVKPIEVLIITTIRSDQFDQLDRVKKYFPDLIRNTYMLNALEWDGAEEAIRKPAAKVGDFFIDPFTYDDEVVTDILNFLTQNNRNKPIAAFELQLFCQYIELILKDRIEKQGKHIDRVERTELPEDLGIVINNFYQNILVHFEGEALNKIRILIEDKLILDVPGNIRRKSLDQAIVLEELGNRQDLLDQLVETRLISGIRTSTGAYIYELSHDALIKPILDTAKERRKEEEEKELKRISDEEIRIEREKAEQERLEFEIEHKRQEELLTLQQARAIEAEKNKQLAEENFRNQLNASRKQKKFILGLAIIAIIAIVTSFLSIYNSARIREKEKKIVNTTIAYHKAEAQAFINTGKYEEALKKYEYLKNVVLSGDTTGGIEISIKNCRELIIKKQNQNNLIINAESAIQAENFGQAVVFLSQALQIKIDTSQTILKLKDLKSLLDEKASRFLRDADFTDRQIEKSDWKVKAKYYKALSDTIFHLIN